MKKNLAVVVAILALASFARSETTVNIGNVHLCCGKCVTAAEKAVVSAGATAAANKETGVVTVKAADDAIAQKAADALVAAGFFGSSDNPAVKVSDTSGAKDEKVTSLTVKGSHLCCDKCVNGIAKALANVKGVTENTAAKGVETFAIKGEFNAREAMSALQKAGYGGKIAN